MFREGKKRDQNIYKVQKEKKSMIVGLSGNTSVARTLAKRLHLPFEELHVTKFPDGELHLRYPKHTIHPHVLFVQSFYPNPNDKLVETIFAAKTMKEWGTKKTTLIATYFPYLRQDKEFKKGEIVSNKLTAHLIESAFDNVYIFDPHLHREAQLSHLFSIPAEKISANSLIAPFVKKNFNHPFIIGPDWESYKWAEKVAHEVGCPSSILKKERLSSRKVKVSLTKKIDLQGYEVIIIDDMISTGHTLLEAIKDLRKIGAKNITCIAVHGLFVEEALQKLKDARVKVITTNTIPNKTSQIDISQLITSFLK